MFVDMHWGKRLLFVAAVFRSHFLNKTVYPRSIMTHAMEIDHSDF
jgi:hypothetical protein